jgi:hypothetical protein
VRVTGIRIAEWPGVFRIFFSRFFIKLIISVFMNVFMGTFLLEGLAFHSSFADTLPYGVRTHAYSGWNATVSGDVRTIGMAGATVGLADTFLAASDNPGGLAMTLQGADENYVTNQVSDSHVQNPNSPNETESLGVAVSLHPWAFSLGLVTTSREGQTYAIPNTPGFNSVTVTSRELRMAASRLLLDDRLSVGLSLNIGQGEEEIEPQFQSGPTSVDHVYRVGATFGGQYQLPNHFLLGASYALPVTYSFSGAGAASQLPGFYQPIVVPERFAMGLGWIPNRNARMDFSVFAVGRSPNAALIRDDVTQIGTHDTFQPRLGAAYVFADFKNVKATAFGGTYFEWSRIDGESNRVHATGGLEVKPYVFTVGIGTDLSSGYSNFILSVGVDLLQVLERVKIVPTPYSPPHQGFLPSAIRLSDAGLPRPMVKDWVQKGPDMNPIEVIKKIPERTKVAVKELKKDWKAYKKKKKRAEKKAHENAQENEKKAVTKKSDSHPKKSASKKSDSPKSAPQDS